MLWLRGYLSTVVILATLDLDDVRTLLALMLRRESMRVRVSLGKAAPLATTACETPAVRGARLGQTPAVCHVGQGSLRRVKK